MVSYRFYLLSVRDKIAATVSLDAQDDADALVKAPFAFTVCDEFPDIEIWRG